jgi:hypothetical protein
VYILAIPICKTANTGVMTDLNIIYLAKTKRLLPFRKCGKSLRNMRTSAICSSVASSLKTHFSFVKQFLKAVLLKSESNHNILNRPNMHKPGNALYKRKSFA